MIGEVDYFVGKKKPTSQYRNANNRAYKGQILQALFLCPNGQIGYALLRKTQPLPTPVGVGKIMRINERYNLLVFLIWQIVLVSYQDERGITLPLLPYHQIYSQERE